MRPSRSAAILLVPYAAAVLWVTLGHAPWSGWGNQSPNGVLDWRNWFESDTWTIGSPSEFLLNILMFVPLGALLAFALRRLPWLVPAVIAGGFALFIEIAQIPMADRISDPRDLVANSIGAVAGILVARLSDAIAGIPAALARRRAAARPRAVSSPQAVAQHHEQRPAQRAAAREPVGRGIR